MSKPKINTREAAQVIKGVPKGQGNGREKALMEHYGISQPEARKLHQRVYRMEERGAVEAAPEKNQLKEDGNKFTFVGDKSKPEALRTLLKECGVTEEEFIIESAILNKWDQHAGFTCGQIKAQLKKRKPELCDWPEIKAVRPKYLSAPKFAKKSKRKLKRALIVPDAQIGYNKVDVHKNVLNPYHDFRAMDIVLQVAQHFKPDEIIMLGDMIDLPNFGRYAKKPEMLFTVQPSLNTLRLFIDDLIPHTSKLSYIYGNHEARFRNFMEEVNVEGSQLKKVDFKNESPFTYSLEYFLGLEELGVNYFNDYPHDEYYLNEHLALSHSHIAKNKSMATVAAIIENDPHVSRIIGHIHRCEQATKTTYKKGRPVTNGAFSPGTLAKLEKTIPQAGTRANWQQGFALVDFEDGDGLFNVHLHHIEQGKALVDGQIFESKYDAKKMAKRIGIEGISLI